MAVFVLDDHADAGATILVHAFGVTGGGQPSDFKNQRGLFVVVENDQGIGRFGIIEVAETSADGEDSRREGLFAEKAAGDVHLVDALVAEVAAPGVPDPMPVVMEARAGEGEFGGWAAPQVVIDRGRCGLFAVHLANAGASFVAKCAGVLELAERFVFYPFQRLGDSCTGAALHAHLDDALMDGGGFDELTTFPDVVRHGFLHIDILSRLDRPDGGEGVPVVGCGDGDNVDLFALEHFPDIGIGRCLVAFGRELRHAFVENGTIDIAEGDDPCAFAVEVIADVVLASPVEADDADADVVIGALGGGVKASGEGKRGACGDGGFKKTAAGVHHKEKG